MLDRELPDKLNPSKKVGERELRFLQVYTETLDLEKAWREAGYSSKRVPMNNGFVQEQMKFIEMNKRYSVQGALALENHHRLMNKFEDGYDEAVSVQDRKAAVGYSSTLARMSEASMKAAGEFDEVSRDSSHTNIQVNIGFFGDQQKEPPAITVEATQDE